MRRLEQLYLNKVRPRILTNDVYTVVITRAACGHNLEIKTKNEMMPNEGVVYFSVMSPNQVP